MIRNIYRARWFRLIVIYITGALVALAVATSARAGSYMVAQCVAGVSPEAEARFSNSSNHFIANRDCGQNSPGFQVRHVLPQGEAGTQAGRFGAWVWTAPPGTVISSGSVQSRLENADGIYGYLAVSPDVGNSVATENQNDDRIHLSAIPVGSWRHFVARLECRQPNQGNRCVGGAFAAHAYVKQLRLQLTDLAAPHLALSGSMFDSGVRRGQHTISVGALDQGAGIRSVSVKVNGQPVAGDDLSAACSPLPSGLTSRMSPCPKGFSNNYALDTAQGPFKNGGNLIEVCVIDYAQTGTPGVDCESRIVLVDSLCPNSPVGGGTKVAAKFSDNGKRSLWLRYARRTMLHGRVRDALRNPVAGAQVCIQARPDLRAKDFRLVGTARTNANGAWTYKLRPGTSRQIRVAYRDGNLQVSRELRLKVRATSTLRVNRRKTHPGKRVRFTGRVPGPHAARRVVVLYGTVPGANRRFLVRRARTNSIGRWNAGYAFTPVPVTTKFVFWAVVPQQNGYPYAQGRSSVRSVRVSP